MTVIENAYREILVESPLYSVYSVDRYTIENGARPAVNLVGALASRKIQFDCFCVGCGQEATFARAGKMQHGYNIRVGSAHDTFMVEMKCTRYGHSYYFWFLEREEGALQKIGMFPSMEDIANSDLKKYRGILGKQHLSELHRAGGLASHGIGIGSFVYLRRIFEKQIADHYERRVEEHGRIEGFEELRVVEKIKAIEDYLPRTLVKHREMYGILSKGVHELDEKTCLSFFPPMRQAIIMILEQDFHIKEKEQTEKALEESFAQMQQAIPKK